MRLAAVPVLLASLIASVGLALLAVHGGPFSETTLIAFVVGAALLLMITLAPALRLRVPHTHTLADTILPLALFYCLLAPWLTTLSPVFSWLRIVLGLGVLLAIAHGSLRLRNPLGSAVHLLLAGFFFWQVVVFIAGPLSAYAASRLLNWLLFAPIAFVVLSPRQTRLLTQAILLSGATLLFGVVLQILGLLQGTWGGSLVRGVGALYLSSREVDIRYTSFLQNPNDLGAVIVIVAAVASIRLGSDRLGRNGRFLLLLLLGACALALIHTDSQAAYLSFAFVALALAATRVVRFPAYMVGVACVLGVLAAVLVPRVGATLLSVPHSTYASIAGEDINADLRSERWTRLLAASPGGALGAGFGGYDPSPPSALGGEGLREQQTRLTVDNGWLKLYLESGVIGLALLSLGIALQLAAGLRTMRLNAAHAVGVVILLSVAVRGLTADVFDVNPWNFLVWVALALTAAPGQESIVTHLRAEVAASAR